jgi:nitronate monooxygenase
MELLRDLVCEVQVPVVAAGGLATPAKVARALDAGAWAVQVGSAYLCCDEATTSPLHREQLQNADAHGTQLTNLFSGRPARGIVNRIMEELGPMSSRVPEFPLASTALAPLRSAAESSGRTDFTPLWCGTDSSGCRSVSAVEQTRWLMSMAT